jgi:hypothetical protein
MVGPYSRLFHRGVLGENIDGRSKLGRFMRDMETQLAAQCGGKPSLTEKLLIEQLVRVRVQLGLFTEKLARGAWTDLDMRTYSGMLHSFRQLCNQLGVEDKSEKPLPIMERLMKQEARERQ